MVAAPGLAILTAMLSARQAQHTADRSALIESADVHQNPLLARLAGQPTGLLALWQETTIRSAANVYSDVVPSRPRRFPCWAWAATDTTIATMRREEKM